MWGGLGKTDWLGKGRLLVKYHQGERLKAYNNYS